jgi:hypothetical protein
MMEQTQNERGRITPIFKKLDYDATRSTPQGGVISPILSNLFLHYTFDLWMGRRVTPIASMADFLFAQLNDRSPSRTTERHSGHIKDRGGQLRSKERRPEIASSRRCRRGSWLVPRFQQTHGWAQAESRSVLQKMACHLRQASGLGRNCTLRDSRPRLCDAIHTRQGVPLTVSCQTQFLPKRLNAETCSNRCRQAAHRKRASGLAA